MAITNHERVGKALELLRGGLAPFIVRELEDHYGERALAEAQRFVRTERLETDRPFVEWDVAPLLRLMWEAWNSVFRKTLGHAERTLVSELRQARNAWAHQEAFSTDDAYRALDSAARLLTAVSAQEAVEVDRMKMELLRVRFDEQMRSERRRSGGAIETPVSGALKPWREVVSPHQDVASGRYQQAEFAADLWQVRLGEGADEYRTPVEFFRRTFVTESLRRLLVGAVRRLVGEGGDPVVQLQTNFGGGKTHSMLALYHLFSGTSPSELAGVDAVLEEAGVGEVPREVRRVVLVGNRISPGNPAVKPDGTVVRTLWGELAWQLGEAAGGASEARRAFERVRADDERATSPGDALRELMNDYGPCLVLIDEWVAYARQLHDESDLPGGSFETHFTFAQALTESAKAARRSLLVISLPASDTGGSPHSAADDVEVGGERGRAALERLRNAVGRVEASWRPASAEEGFEIVRRRLFQPLTDREHFVARDTVARAFFELYRTQHAEFPPECRDSDYEKRLRAGYPIHPEVFDRLYGDWSTLVKFQRTRGVLRLMAAVIHSLWEKGDKNPLILPASLPIDDPRVQFELTRYLSDNWTPVIEKDVDGPNAHPLRLDGELPNLGKYAACRRVARTIYLGSAPIQTAAHQGIEERRVRLGCVMPGEPISIFSDALRRLAATATYLYHDGTRYWYSTQPTVTKVAEDRAEQFRRDPDKVAAELERRLRDDLRAKGDFNRVHPLPQSSQEVPDDLDARLVVLSSEHPYSKEPGSKAETEARSILAARGNAPRIHQNTLVFLAADQGRLQDLDEALRRLLAWQSIVEEKEELELAPHQVRQAQKQLESADKVVEGRIPEAYQWLLVPEQRSPESAVEWKPYKVGAQDRLAARVSKRLKRDELLITTLAGTELRRQLDRVLTANGSNGGASGGNTLWRGDHVPIRQLAEDFARYVYLPRLASATVLRESVEDGLQLLTWERDSFAYADSYDEASGRYRGLRARVRVAIAEDDPGLLVRPEAARRQFDAETPPGAGDQQAGVNGDEAEPSTGDDAAAVVSGEEPVTVSPPPEPRRFHGTVALDPTRVGRDAGRIADEVIAHLAGLVGAEVEVTLEIEATIPGGAPEHVVRTVTENGRTLKFTSQGFERE